ncbi:putative staphylococcal-like nuclease CAN1 [Canna indica]|uniref:Staphylococcal-like nuclease CAN1 n=1 Tax=Canna indica TaxID=4628 RepID=A0AAQ3Q380_9LILI|nr:putative staphylococcal-like nuclease CAN1 [Canna indica]
MGNSLISCLKGNCFDDTLPLDPTRLSRPGPHGFAQAAGAALAQSLGSHGVTHGGVAVLAYDLLSFESSYQVPEELSKHVVSSKWTQLIWYKKLLEAWKEAKPTPRTPEEAAALVVRALTSNQKSDVEGLLAYYGLPIPSTLETASATTWNEGVQVELITLPVDARDVVDGDGITAYVDTADPKESANVPASVHEATISRTKARSQRNYTEADQLKRSISDAGYGFKSVTNGEEILAKKCRIRLRGIDAPESEMEYGKEAREELAKLVIGKCLRIQVYGLDRYGRHVADVYCDGIFVQEEMLKRGLAWHYVAYDKRADFKRWQKEARVAGRGLWASPKPEKPWDWRKRNTGWREGSGVAIEVSS